MTEENEYEYDEVTEDNGQGLQAMQDHAKAEFDEFLQSKEFLDLNEFGRIKAMMKRMGVEINDPNPKCNHCYGRGWTGKRASTGEPIMCTCVQPEMNTQTKSAYDQRANLPKNRRERRAMLRMMTKAQGNFTKKTKSRKK
jgi:hypothetical protein